MKYVVLATDLHENYLFYAPLTCAMWKAAGWTPMVFLVGDEGAWRADACASMVLNQLREQTVHLHFTGNWPKRNTATVAQLVRIYGASVMIKDRDYLLTSDIDMWPLGKWIGHVTPAPAQVHLYNGMAYAGQEHPQYPMCYVGAEVATWRRIVGEGSLQECLAQGFADFDYASDGWALHEVKERTWDFDERYLGWLLKETDTGNRVVIPRNMGSHGQRRLDRSCWRVPADLSGFADAHLPRPGFGGAWVSIAPILEARLSAEMLIWANGYHKAWGELR